MTGEQEAVLADTSLFIAHEQQRLRESPPQRLAHGMAVATQDDDYGVVPGLMVIKV